jgi:hypothetical protein
MTALTTPSPAGVARRPKASSRAATNYALFALSLIGLALLRHTAGGLHKHRPSLSRHPLSTHRSRR